MSVSHKTGVTPRKASVTMFLAESNIGHKICRPGDIVINTMWAFMAALGVSQQVGIVSPSYGVYRPRSPQRLLPNYIDLLLRTEPYRCEYMCRSTGITSSRLRLYPDAFLRIPVVCPPLSEQAKIIEYVQHATSELQKALNQTQSEIELIHEFQNRLIADVVTGKLDVRDATARLPEDAADIESLDESEDVADEDSLIDESDLDEATLEAGT